VGQAPTSGAIRRDLRTGSAGKPARWLLRRPSEDAAARIFCFPYSGCGASMYYQWPAQAGAAEFCLLQPPGRENRLREPHYGDFESLAEQLLPHLLPYLDRPFGFFGHCAGALPAFATTLELMRRELPLPAVLFLSSQVAPHQGPHGRFLSMTDDELGVELAGLMHLMGGTPDPDLIALGLGVLRADVEANKRYRLSESVTVPCRLTAIGWQDDREITVEQMAGWADWAAPGNFRQVVLPGEHYTFLSAPPALLDELALDMAQALAEAGRPGSDRS
jgi:surfactin synthase thioesterase subunit